MFPGLLAGLLALTAPGFAQTPPDRDGDEPPDAADTCLVGSNPDQADADGDGIGDACALTPADAQDNGRLGITPKTLNRTRNGRVVTTVSARPPAFNPAGIDLSRRRLEGVLPIVIPPTPTLRDGDADGTPERMVTCSRRDLIGVLCDTGRDQGPVELRGTGRVAGPPCDVRGSVHGHGPCP